VRGADDDRQDDPDDVRGHVPAFGPNPVAHPISQWRPDDIEVGQLTPIDASGGVAREPGPP
jgi:hypothetical protein